jgi:hypothetical protein
MKFRNLNKVIIGIMFCVAACQNKPVAQTAHTDSEGYDKGSLNTNYDWTGTYELKDGENLFVLKLHKRSVDGSYEMQFFNSNQNTELYKSSIYDANDADSSICIRFLNNFQMDASPLGYKSGDTLFVLRHYEENDSTFWKLFSPSSSEMQFKKTSNTY